MYVYELMTRSLHLKFTKDAGLRDLCIEYEYCCIHITCKYLNDIHLLNLYSNNHVIAILLQAYFVVHFDFSF